MKILADSLSPDNIRLTTMSVSYPRIIHAEMLRHRMFSRCAASSRAIPVERFIEQVENEPYLPQEFRANKSGMQAGDPLSEEKRLQSRDMWLYARDSAVQAAKNLVKIGVHKQWTNRLLEPFQWMTEVITATEWDNFFHLHVHPDTHPDTHPDIQRIAGMMQEAMKGSTPSSLGYYRWHLPLISEAEMLSVPKEQLTLASIGRVARVSYLRHEDESNLEKDIERAHKMLAHGHMSPFEHVARPMSRSELRTTATWEVILTSGLRTRLQAPPDEPPEVGDSWGIYGGDSGVNVLEVLGDWKAFCGNFNGWVQYLKRPGSSRTCWGRSMTTDEEFKEAVLKKDAKALGACVDYFRMAGLRYREIVAKAKSIDPTLTDAEWDTLMEISEDE